MKTNIIYNLHITVSALFCRLLGFEPVTVVSEVNIFKAKTDKNWLISLEATVFVPMETIGLVRYSSLQIASS